MSNIEKALTSLAEVSNRNIEGMEKQTKEFSSMLADAKENVGKFSGSVKSSAGDVEEFGKKVKSAGTIFTDTLVSIGKNIWNKFGGLENLGKQADAYSKMSNQLIQSSGVIGAGVKDFRTDITALIDDLNTRTGYAYNPQEYYGKLVEISGNVTSNLEAMREMAEPLLLAQETLNMDIGSIATLFNKMYTRYNFSSSHMEGLLTEIRGNTANNSTDEKAIGEAITQLQSYIGLYSSGSPGEIQSMMESVSNYVTGLESQGIDSKIITNILEKVLTGDAYQDSSLVQLFSAAGSSVDTAQALARSGKFTAVSNLLTQGIENLIDTTGGKGNILLGPTWDAMGIDRAYLDVYAALKSPGYKTTEEVLSGQDDLSLEELVESKYVSATDKMTNTWLDKIHRILADIQEKFGIGLSDIAIIVALLGGPTANLAKGLLKKGGGAAGSAAGSAGGISGTMLAGGGIALAGGALGVHGISGMWDSANEDDLKGMGISAIEGAAGLTAAGVGIGMMTGAVALSNPVGWVALAIAGVAAVGKAYYEAAKTIGPAEAISKAYDDAAAAIQEKADKQEQTLLMIQDNLDQGKDLETVRNELINSGILSETDREKLLKNWSDDVKKNEEAIRDLTQAYLVSTNQFSDEATEVLMKYKDAAESNVYDLWSNIEEKLQTWNDEGSLKDNSEGRLDVAEQFFKTIKYHLDSQDSSTMSEETKDIYGKLVEAFDRGGDGGVSLTGKEANSIIDAGWSNTTLQNMHLTPEVIMQALRLARDKGTNNTGEWFYQAATKGVDISKIKSEQDVTTMMNSLATIISFPDYQAIPGVDSDTAKKVLDGLKKRGISSSAGFAEVARAAEAYGLEGYATGTNYITHDQIAVLHEGEAVVPKRYNPAANRSELEMLRKQSRERDMQDNSKSQESITNIRETLSEIKEFLAYWREDNIRREQVNSIKGKNAANVQFLSQYMVTE